MNGREQMKNDSEDQGVSQDLRWDRACTMILASVPFVVLAWYIPEPFKIVLSIAWIIVTVVAAISIPPIGLYVMLTGILESPLLFAQGASQQSNWGKFLALALVIGLVLRRVRFPESSRRPLFLFPNSTWAFVLIAVAIGLSAIHNARMDASLYTEFVTTTAIFVLIYNCITSRRQLHVTMVGLLALGLTVIGLNLVASGLVERVYLDKLGVGVFGNPNGLALLLATLLPYALYFIYASNKAEHRLRLLGIVSVLVFLFMFFAAASRGATVGLLCGLGLWIWAVRPPARHFVFVSILLLVAILLVMPSSVREVAWQHYVNSATSAQGSVEQRQILLKNGIAAFLKEPVFGYGLGRSRFEVVAMTPWLFGGQKSTHNFYLQVGLELGVLGLSAVVFLIALAIVSNIRVALESRRVGESSTEILAWSFATSVTIIAVASFFQGTFWNRVWYISLGIAMAVADARGWLPHAPSLSLPEWTGAVEDWETGFRSNDS